MGNIRAKMSAVLLLLYSCTAVFLRAAIAQSDPSNTFYNYQDLYQTQWSGDHINVLSNGAQVQIVLDYQSGTDLLRHRYIPPSVHYHWCIVSSKLRLIYFSDSGWLHRAL